MAATNADAEYLDRMLRLHPGNDAPRIITDRASYIAARPAGNGISAGDSSAAIVARGATQPRLLPERWYEQTIEVDVPLRAGDGKEEVQLETRGRWNRWVVWWIGLALFCKIVAMLASRP